MKQYPAADDLVGPIQKVAMPRAGRLYAVMFMLSLAMEIYGTWLGNWTWAEEAPWLGFTTINPPLAAGAFYCMLDLLVVATAARARPTGPGIDSLAISPSR